MIFIFSSEKKAVKLNRNLVFNFLGEKQRQFKAVLHLLFLCLNRFSSLTRIYALNRYINDKTERTPIGKK